MTTAIMEPTSRQGKPMTYDPVVMDELRHEKACQMAQEATEAAIDEILPGIHNEIACGEYDRDLASYFDNSMLMKIARNLAGANEPFDLGLAYSRVAGDLMEIRSGIDDYAKDLAKQRTGGN